MKLTLMFLAGFVVAVSAIAIGTVVGNEVIVMQERQRQQAIAQEEQLAAIEECKSLIRQVHAAVGDSPETKDVYSEEGIARQCTPGAGREK